jgi:hypothetical protein
MSDITIIGKPIQAIEVYVFEGLEAKNHITCEDICVYISTIPITIACIPMSVLAIGGGVVFGTAFLILYSPIFIYNKCTNSHICPL